MGLEWITTDSTGTGDLMPKPQQYDQDTMAVLQDKEQAEQIRHYITTLCSHRNEKTDAFCKNLIKNYMGLFLIDALTTRFSTTIDRWVKNKDRSFRRYLEKLV